MTAHPAYTALERRFARVSALGDAIGILDWDSQTTMPAGAAAGRAEQLATLRVLSHETMTAPDMGELIDQAEREMQAADGDAEIRHWQQANLREMRRQWIHANAVPSDLVEASSRAISASEMAWRTARAENDFPALLPYLREVLTLQRRIAEAKADLLGTGLYDALLDQYEPEGRSAKIDLLFADLAEFLPGFIQSVLDHQAAQPPVIVPEGPFPVDTQRRMGEALMKAIGFDFTRGRLDVSLHPFCGGATGDVRLTTRYEEGDFTSALMGVLHETGHAMYELGRPAAWLTQPVGAARGMALHESQSLIVEMQACRSPHFLRYAAPLLREAFGGTGPAWTEENLYRLYTRVERGFIRVDADEATYPAHVILRYRLEKALIEGAMDLADLPDAWNEGMRDLLGIVPPDDRRGCLQDIHWPSGAWGYFPTYTMGAIAAAQLFDSCRTAVPKMEEGLARGDFGPLIGWLRANVHSLGSVDTTDGILARATGRGLDAEVYKRHLRRRYLRAEE
ncbi:carboxypeptidase M32 [Indioceanicola profundi]|uniref:carboxypeptidase M32 n=1 Tax=Indioceanicola profundi TaxID=2220096 RepID=UPI000E6AB37F|nr:carboxypeptidase M32 [Indioceanicola profundi]